MENKIQKADWPFFCGDAWSCLEKMKRYIKHFSFYNFNLCIIYECVCLCVTVCVWEFEFIFNKLNNKIQRGKREGKSHKIKMYHWLMDFDFDIHDCLYKSNMLYQKRTNIYLCQKKSWFYCLLIERKK